MAVVRTDLRLADRREGKVRDVYALDAHRALLVATDRLSAFDVVLPTAIPGKGVLLTTLAAWWLRWIEARGLARTHLVSTDVSDIPSSAFDDAETARGDLGGRVMVCRMARVIPVECVVRGYLDGSGYADYLRDGAVCGIPLAAGLVRGDRLERAIFTPSTKAEQGAHDESIPFERACEIAGDPGLMRELRDRSIAIYEQAAAHALDRGIILADTKFEWGIVEGEKEPILIDEALTPDSSRFWAADEWRPDGPQVSFDKQYVRDYLQQLVDEGSWDKTDPGPELPERVVEGTLSRYREAIDRLTA